MSLTYGALPIIERAHRRDTSPPSTVAKAQGHPLTGPLPLIQVLLPHLRVRRGVPETAKRVVSLTRLVVLSRGSGRASGAGDHAHESTTGQRPLVLPLRSNSSIGCARRIA